MLQRKALLALTLATMVSAGAAAASQTRNGREGQAPDRALTPVVRVVRHIIKTLEEIVIPRPDPPPPPPVPTP